MPNTELKRMEDYFDRLWPLPRSIMGAGFRDSLKILSEIVPFETRNCASGTKLFDWTVPQEWVVRDAYLIDPQGKRRAEFTKNNLHLVSYSIPFRGTMSLAELKSHLHTLQELPHAIPYVTSYYKPVWGFCLTHDEYKSLPEGNYQVVVDTELKPGILVSGEAVLPGKSDQEILFSSYLCHPSMANNELSGPLALAFLYEKIAAMPKRKYTYRFVINTETIGTIFYLSQRGEHLKKNLLAGYVLTCVGDAGKFTYKKSLRENSLADRAALAVLEDLREKQQQEYSVTQFDPTDGSEDRQYNSPGFDLPIGSLMRTMYGQYPEYHTSLDNKDYISFAALQETVEAYYKIAEWIEGNQCWQRTEPHCEPQLGKRGLYPSQQDLQHEPDKLRAMLWMLSYSDGDHGVFDIAAKSKLSVSVLRTAALELEANGLLKKIEGRE